MLTAIPRGYTGWMLFISPNQQHQTTEGLPSSSKNIINIIIIIKIVSTTVLFA